MRRSISFFIIIFTLLVLSFSSFTYDGPSPLPCDKEKEDMLFAEENCRAIIQVEVIDQHVINKGVYRYPWSNITAETDGYFEDGDTLLFALYYTVRVEYVSRAEDYDWGFAEGDTIVVSQEFGYKCDGLYWFVGEDAVCPYYMEKPQDDAYAAFPSWQYSVSAPTGCPMVPGEKYIIYAYAPDTENWDRIVKFTSFMRENGVAPSLIVSMTVPLKKYEEIPEYKYLDQDSLGYLDTYSMGWLEESARDYARTNHSNPATADGEILTFISVGVAAALVLSAAIADRRRMKR